MGCIAKALFNELILIAYTQNKKRVIEKGHSFGLDLVLVWWCFGVVLNCGDLVLESFWSWIGARLEPIWFWLGIGFGFPKARPFSNVTKWPFSYFVCSRVLTNFLQYIDGVFIKE